ncbi:MAG: radical SAM protein [Halobacteriota archaeon]
MPQNFLDLHILDFCQLNCKHCYLNKGNSVMPLDMLRAICTDFLKTALPLPQSAIILSGGDPLLHPNLIEACNIVRKLNGRVTMSTNGILIPKRILINVSFKNLKNPTCFLAHFFGFFISFRSFFSS